MCFHCRPAPFRLARGLVVWLAVLGCLTHAAPVGLRAAPPVADPGGVGMDAEVLAGIPGAMQQFVDARQISGAVTLVARRGKLVHLAAVGQADIDSGRPMRPDALFGIASMTKPITATAVMILCDEGKLSLEDPAERYIPEFGRTGLADGSASRPITIRDLLTHTSGLAGGQQNLGTLAETAVQMAARPLAFQPGTRWQYSPGLTICGRVVEVVSGQPLEQFLEERIFRPLRMTDTTFFPSPQQQKRLARLYQPGSDGKSLVPAEHWLIELSEGRTANPSGGLFSTAADLFRFYQMILNGGELDATRIVSTKAVEEMTRLQTGDLQTGFTPGNGWGLGWCIVRQPQGPSEMLSPGSFGHGGALGTQGWIDPTRQMICVLLIHRTGFGNSDASDLRQALQRLAVEAVTE